MTRIEEPWNLYLITSDERRRRADGYTIAYVGATEICDALEKQGIPVDRKHSTRSLEWNRRSARFVSLVDAQATVPLDTAFPDGIEQVTRSMHLCGTYGKRGNETYDLVLNDTPVEQRISILLRFESDIDTASSIIRRFKDAFRSLEVLLATEANEEQKKREANEKRHNEETGYVHPDSFGGSDFL